VKDHNSVWIDLPRYLCAVASVTDFQIRQASFEIAADHLIHVHEEAERFGHEIILAEHDPRDGGLIALRLEGELRRRGRSERFDEFKPASGSDRWYGSR